MNRLITVLYVLYFVSYMLGCAYKGTVYINSPQGEGNIISKAVSTSAEIPLLP